ncbi:serine carboxypeptidase-like 2 [Juglans microcarpa x Juglans regia]|uniref:serine carboxypeptidase-like 2 n=1 Tax=Juglans microcarpa x Juglans regia TaxID=2249226 RepID=UPI001B7F36B1|nr:serine carboxypeptidase-like 2 [Juglans microcarpa x Juglans regia]
MKTSVPGQRPKNLFNSSSSYSSSSSNLTMWWPSVVVLVHILLLISNSVESQSIIDTLPGFPGKLPFKLETGYIGVGELDEVQLFYYFIESERSPKDDLLVLWLTGGPGCSGLSGLIYEIGPLSFNYANSSGNKPTFELNPYSWTKVANIIFLDAPVGTGFSYAKSWELYNSSDTSSTAQTYEFLRKWLVTHSNFLSNPLYIAGDSYSGITIPIIVQDISNGNEIGHRPPMNLKGYVLGNPFTDVIFDLNSRIKFAHRTALISDKLYQSTKTSCKGEYMRPDPNNTKCMEDLQIVDECIAKIYTPHILEPKCAAYSPKPNKLWNWSPLGDDFFEILTSTPQVPGPWCRNYDYLYSYIWANDKTVRNALHVRDGTITDWDRCNKSLIYAHNIITSIDYQQNLTKKDLRALVYGGDHDLTIPYVGTQEWIESLDLSIKDNWRPWFVDGQIAGYVTIYTEKKYSLTFTTIKGGGHTAPEYKPKECLAMIDRWFSYYFL